MSSILVTSKIAKKSLVSAKSVENPADVIHFYYGYLESSEEAQAVTQSFLSAFLMSLITHDTIYVRTSDFTTILTAIGAEQTLKLLDNKIIKVILGTDDLVVERNEVNLKLSYGTFEWSELDGIEEILSKKIPKNLRPKIIQYIDNSSVRADNVSPIVMKEIACDLERKSFRDEFDLKTENIENVSSRDGYGILRLSECAQSLIIQNRLGIDSIYQDAHIKNYAEAKLGNFARTPQADSLAGFEKVMNLKGIPDLLPLLKKGTITIDDILKCRNTFNGGIFRKWYSNENFDSQELISALMTPAKQSATTKLIRLLYPNVLGIFSPLVGLAASTADSYLIEKLVTGWRPSLFLDDVLKTSLDIQIKRYEEKAKRDEIIARFGSVERNAPCPCQSGKKFKKCHGA